MRFRLSILLFASMALAMPAFGKSQRRTGQPKHLTGTGSSTSTKIDMDAADITAGPKIPTIDMVGAGKSDKNYDFIKIRTRWHPEMIQSAAFIAD